MRVEPKVEVRRSARRKRTVTAYRERDITLLVTSPLDARHPAGPYVQEHGAGVAVVGFAVEDAAAAFAEAVRRGARPVAEPTSLRTTATASRSPRFRGSATSYTDSPRVPVRAEVSRPA